MFGICTRAFGTERQADPLEQPHQIERTFDVHAVEHLVGGEVVDLDHQPFAQFPEFGGQTPENFPRQEFEIHQ
jgi:hypothetical protein